MAARGDTATSAGTSEGVRGTRDVCAVPVRTKSRGLLGRACSEEIGVVVVN